MNTFIVTIKLEKLKQHKSKNKQIGICRHNPGQCTDITGSHHSFLHSEKDESIPINQIGIFYESLGLHVTRVEEVQEVTAK